MVVCMIYIYDTDDMSKYIMNQDSICSIPTGLRKNYLKSTSSVVRFLLSISFIQRTGCLGQLLNRSLCLVLSKLYSTPKH